MMALFLRTESGLCIITILSQHESVGFFYICFMNKFFLLIASHLYFFSFSQDTLMPIVFLDDVIISEENNGFDVEDFIYYVKNDTTFYMGFKHLKYYSHKFESSLNIFNKKNKKIASIDKYGDYHTDNNKAWVSYDSTHSNGRMFKRNGKHRFYTPEAFDEVFFPKDTIDVSLDISKTKNKGESQNMRDAKTVGFSIGSDATEQKKGGLNKKLAVFSIDMQKYYDYTISDTIYNNIECYVFTIKMKDSVDEKDMKKVLIRNLVSYFDKTNFNVLYREYKFIYNHFLISLDIDVVVHMDYVNKKHVPTKIYYNGFWNVFLFKPERADFSLLNSDYIIN